VQALRARATEGPAGPFGMPSAGSAADPFASPFADDPDLACVILRAGDALPPLPAAERALTGPMVASRRREFAWGREAARRALTRLGLACGALLPDADRVPVWPSGVTGSISHGGGLCGAAVARGPRSVGFDIEARAGLDPDLWPEVLTGAERVRLSGLPAEHRGAAALALFTAKEAAFKAHFPIHRQMFGFADLEIAEASPDGFVAAFPGRSGAPWTRIAGRWRRGDTWTASGVVLAIPAPEVPRP